MAYALRACNPEVTLEACTSEVVDGELKNTWTKFLNRLIDVGCNINLADVDIAGEALDTDTTRHDKFVMIAKMTCGNEVQMVISHPGTETYADIMSDLTSAISVPMDLGAEEYYVGAGFTFHYDYIQGNEQATMLPGMTSHELDENG